MNAWDIIGITTGCVFGLFGLVILMSVGSYYARRFTDWFEDWRDMARWERYDRRAAKETKKKNNKPEYGG